MIEVKSCPVCGGTTRIPYTNAIGKPDLKLSTDITTFDVQIVSHYDQCLQCGCIFQNPRMTDDELYRYYADGWYRKWVEAPPEAQDQDELTRSMSVYNTIKEIAKVKKLYSHLDVGCSRGYLLNMTKQEWGLSTSGIEPNLEYVTKQPDYLYHDIADVEYKFDLITSIHVLEHLPNPVHELKHYHRLLNPDGYLVVEIPSDRSPGSPFRLAHLTHMPAHVLNLALTAAGFHVTAYMLTPHQRVIARKNNDPVRGLPHSPAQGA